MRLMFKAIPLLTVCAAIPALATMTVNFDGQAHSTWDGEGGDGCFGTAINWSDDTVPVQNTWRYTHFNLSEDLVVTNNETMSIFGVVVDATSTSQLTFRRRSDWLSSGLRIWAARNDKTAFVNYSDVHAIFDIRFYFDGWSRNGRSGVHPGAEYLRNFDFELVAADSTLVFFSGDPDWSEYRKTSVFKADLNCTCENGYNAVEIQEDHIVSLEGSSAQLQCGDLVVNGRLVLSNATAVAHGSVSCDGEIVVFGGGTIDFTNMPAKVTLVPDFALNGANRLVTSFKLKVAKHDDLTITADNFDIEPTGVTPAALNVSIAEDGDYWAVTITPSEFIPCKTGSWGGAWDGSSTWNGNVVCAAGSHYIVRSQNNATQDPDNRRLNNPAGDAGGTFPGDSLTLVADSGYTSFLALKGNATYTFNRLNLGANGAVRFYTGSTTVAGNIYVGSDTADEPASFGNSHDTACTVSADISGTGSLHIQPTDVNNTVKNFNLALSGDNSNFTGELVIESNAHEETLAKAYVTIAKENALGSGKVTIDNSTLKVTDDITAAQTFTFANSPVVEVASGKTLSLSGTNSMGTVVLNGGNIQAVSPCSAWNVSIAGSSTGSAYLPELSATAEELSARKFLAKDWLFVPGGSTTDAAADNLALMTAKGWVVPANYGLEKKWVTTLDQRADAVAGVQGVMLTVSGKMRGLMVIIR